MTACGESKSWFYSGRMRSPNERNNMSDEKTKSKCKLLEGDIVPPTCADREAMSTVAMATREENAKQIGELQARVSQLEGELGALRKAVQPAIDVMIKARKPGINVETPARSHEDSGTCCCGTHSSLSMQQDAVRCPACPVHGM